MKSMILILRAWTTNGKIGPMDLSKNEKWFKVSERLVIQQMDP